VTVIPALREGRGLKQEHHELEAILGFTVRPCLKERKNRK
jgi:hypothetical protein